METEARELREKATRLAREAQAAGEALELYEKRCPHKWSEARYTPTHYPAYEFPGDEPGTMGVDWRGPVYIPASTTEEWTRECQRCGLVQTTQRVEKEITINRKPQWSN